jgi:hypothetical protein
MIARLKTPLAGIIPSPQLLAELISYDPETGLMQWLPRSDEMFASKRAAATWNTRYAGHAALTALGLGGYREGRIFYRLHRAHRVAYTLMHGHWPEHEIDHINGNRVDNRFVNLRAVTHAENCRNARLRSHNASGVHGVSWFARDNTWQVHITRERQRFYLGRFENKADAIAARRAAEAELGFHKNHGRAT